MRLIKKGNAQIIKIWGKPKIKDLSYRFMKYVLKSDVDGNLLLHNNVTGEMVALDIEESNILKSGELNSHKEILKELIEKHFLVPEEFDEEKSVNQLRALIKKIKTTKDILSYTILPTTACNARCFYCYESDYPKQTMDENTAHKVVKFIERHCGEKKKINIHWFGGEPLVGEIRIDQICSELDSIGIEYSASMISNGYLFTKESVNKAKDKWHLTNVQITLDGTEDIYNKTKAYQSAIGSPYYKVLDNIQLLLDNNIRVSVRMNMDRHNSADLLLLIDELANRFKGNDYFSAYTAVLFDDEGFQPVRHTLDDKVYLNKKKSELDERLKEKGLYSISKRLPVLKFGSCMADNSSSVLINPLGGIGKCEHKVFESIVGDIDRDFTDKKIISNWQELQKYDECSSCCLYPKCMNLKLCDTKNNCTKESIENEIKEYKELMKKLFLEN